MLRAGTQIDPEVAMVDDFNPGAAIDTLNAGARAEARAMEADLPRPRHLEARRWPDVGTLVRRTGLVLVAIVLTGWVLTLLNAR